MTSEVEISNLALSHVRGGSINNLNEASRQAQLCKLHYPVLRDQVLREAPWQFAHVVRALALLTDEPFNWKYAYQYPADCFAINRVMNGYEAVNSDNTSSVIGSRYYDPLLPQFNLHPAVAYERQLILGNRVVVTNEPEARISYRSKVTDPNLFDSQFVVMLSHLLGSALAIPLVGGEGGRLLRADQFKIYQNYIDAAAVSDLNEQSHEVPDSDYVIIRS